VAVALDPDSSQWGLGALRGNCYAVRHPPTVEGHANQIEEGRVDMSVHIERKGDVAVVRPKGNLRGGKETEALEQDMRKLIYDDHKKILLDLADIKSMSSIGIGMLASLHVSAMNRGLQLHVCNIERRIKDVLAIVQLTRVLNCFDTYDEALAAFKN
jgi:anti-anti-sigma factor